MTFQALGLTEPIVRAVAAEGYTTPTPIQAQAIPEALAGRDVFGCAQTGTGKTCAFALPTLDRLADPATKGAKAARDCVAGRPPRGLILCPTRELATQIFDSLVAYGRHLPLRYGVVYGGVNQSRQVRGLRSGVDVLVATPGRLFDLINQGYAHLGSVETLVLDEADRMLDMGFINDIRKIVEMLPENHQTLFFSATVSPKIRKLAGSMLYDPVSIQTAQESTTAQAITQRLYKVDKAHKHALLERLLRSDKVGRALVFTRTKHGADKLVKFLRGIEIPAEAIHGNKSQNARNRAMQRFRSGASPVLVATDVASRGIDVDEITHVVNFDMPIDPETYVHRIGRTARAGASGVAVSLCSREESSILRAIEHRTRGKLEVMTDMPDIASAAQPDRPAHRPVHKAGPGKVRPSGGRPGKASPNKRSRKKTASQSRSHKPKASRHS